MFAGVIAGVGLGVPLLLALLELDYLNPRNLIAVVLPASIVLASGLAARHPRGLGLALTVAFCLAAIVQVVSCRP